VFGKKRNLVSGKGGKETISSGRVKSEKILGSAHEKGKKETDVGAYAWANELTSREEKKSQWLSEKVQSDGMGNLWSPWQMEGDVVRIRGRAAEGKERKF